MREYFQIDYTFRSVVAQLDGQCVSSTQENKLNRNRFIAGVLTISIFNSKASGTVGLWATVLQFCQS